MTLEMVDPVDEILPRRFVAVQLLGLWGGLRGGIRKGRGRGHGWVGDSEPWNSELRDVPQSRFVYGYGRSLRSLRCARLEMGHDFFVRGKANGGFLVVVPVVVLHCRLLDTEAQAEL